MACATKYKLSVCKGLLEYYGDHFINSILTYPTDPSYVCGNYFNYCDSRYTILKEEDYIEEMLRYKPEIIKNDDYVTKLYESHPAPKSTIKVVHITDVHLDLDYEEGTNMYCDYVVCCRKINGYTDSKSKRATKYGGYQCDTPITLLTTMGDYINEKI